MGRASGHARTTYKGPWSRVALLRKRSIDPGYGHAEAALQRSFICDARSSFKLCTGLRSHTVVFSETLFLANRCVLELKVGQYVPRVLCRLPTDVALRQSPPSFTTLSEFHGGCASATFHPTLYALTSSSKRLLHMNMLTGRYRYIFLSHSLKYHSVYWAQEGHWLVLVTTRPRSNDPIGLVVFNAVPFRLLCVLRLDRQGVFKSVHDIAVRGDMLVIEQRLGHRGSKPTLHCYNLTELIQEHSVDDSKAYSLLRSDDLFAEDLSEGLPETIRLVSWPAARLLIPGLELGDFDVEVSARPHVYLSRTLKQGGTNSYVLHSLATGENVEYLKPAQPFAANGNFGDEQATLETYGNLLLYSGSKSVEVLRYFRDVTMSHYCLQSLHKVAVCDLLDEQRQEQHRNTPRVTRSGRLVRAPVIPRCDFQEFEDSPVKCVYSDPDFRFLVVCNFPGSGDRPGSVNVYDLFSGKILKNITLYNVLENHDHRVILYGDRLMHIQGDSGRSTVSVYNLVRDPPSLQENGERSLTWQSYNG